MSEPKPSRVRFSTDDLPPDQRFAVWSEGFVHRKMEMEFIDRSTDGLRFTVEFIPLGGVAAGIVHGTPSIFIRKPIDENDALYMVINRQGRFRVVLQDQGFELAIGDAAVLDLRRHGELHCLEEGETWSLSLPREALRHLVRDIEQTIERHIPASNPTLRLLTGYLETLFVLDAIAQSAGDPDLAPAQVAGALGMSVRYLHRLLEDSGRTFSEHLLERRLDRAHRLLRDPRLAYRKISEIALEAGFADLSHFNRSFRRRFGETPSQARAMAAR